MTNKRHADDPIAASSTAGGNEGRTSPDGAGLAALPSLNDAEPAGLGEPTPARKLSPEEQMALYEKDLKENDWGHQPC